MDKKDLEEFKEAFVKMSEEDDETKVESVGDREKLLEEYQQETSQLELENIALKMENSILSNSVDHDKEVSDIDCQVQEIPEPSMANEEESCEQVEIDNNYDKDDLSSIFSEDEEELRSLVEGNDTIKSALKNLRKERDFWIMDTASETSDDGDTSISARSLRDNYIDKIQISKLLADKEFLELKLSQVTNEKLETETKLRYLEKDKLGADAKRYREAAHIKVSSLTDSLQAEHSNSNMRPSKENPQKAKEKTREHSKAHTQRRHKTRSGITGMSEAELVHFLKSRSISPQLVKGYENDIALLAEENEKLGEIIDHLHVSSDNEQTPRLDPMEAFIDAFENRVSKEEYLRVENEKTKLEHALREKERQIKERDRIIEESKFDYEDEVKLLRESLKRMEEKMREKAREAGEYEIQIIELKSSFEDQVANLENELSMENEQKMRVEEINIGLADSNRKLQKEIDDLKNTIARLQAREKELENRYSNELRMLEEKFLNENREKTHLSGNLEGLMSDLMVLKNKLLEESGKTGKMREEFEKERSALGGAPSPRTNLKVGKLALGINLRSRMRPESDGQTNMNAGVVPRPATDQMELMDSGFHPKDEIQPVDANEYKAIIEEQKEKIESLEKAIQEIKDNQQEKQFNDETKGAQNDGEVDMNNNRASQPTSTLKHEIDELNQENAYLKQKMEELGKEKAKRRELEEKNEELQEEISQTTRKRNDLQRKQESMNNEIEEMNEKVEELERSNVKLTKETDRLTNKIKEMEESFNEEKANLASSFERQKEMSEKELNQALEKEQERYKEMEDEIKSMRDEVSVLLAKIKDMENQHNEELDKSSEKLEEEKKKALQLEEQLKKNEDDVRKVTEEWEKILKNTTQKYEAELKRLQEKNQRIMNSGQGLEKPIDQNQSYNVKSESSYQPAVVDNAYMTSSIPDNLQSSPWPMENEVISEMPLVNEEIPVAKEEAKCVESELPLQEKVPESPRVTCVEEPLSVVSKVNVTENKTERERIQAGNGIEFEYTSMMPNLQIQVELEDKPYDGKSGRHDQDRINVERIQKLEGEKNELRNAVNRNLNEIQTLSERINQLEQELVRKDQELALLAEKEKNANNILKSKLEENSRYYQGMLENLKEKLQNEKQELEERLSKESEEMQRLLKEEFQNNLSSKSAVLENKIHELVADKVRSYKDEIQKLEHTLQNEKSKFAEYEKSKDEITKRLEREKKLLRVTIDALTKELNKAKQDKKDVKKEYKKTKAGMQKASEEERKAFNESLEKAKEVQKLKIEEELRAKYRIDVEKYEEKLVAMNDEIQQYENKMEEIVVKFKEEKFKLENDLQDAILELENVKENQKEFKITLEEEYRQKHRKEKENIESTLESLRQEITRLREHRMQLESQLQQHAHYKPEKNPGYNTTHAQSAESILNNKEIFTRIENEYQNQLQKEKEYFENKIRELEKDYESLAEEMSHMKTKYRQERISMKTEFEIERRDLEERYEREKRDLQASMQMRMQGLRDPRMGQQVDRSVNMILRNRRLQSEVDVLQEKISRLENLSPRLIDRVQRSSVYGDPNMTTSVHSSAHSSTMGRPSNMYQNDSVNKQMVQSSYRGVMDTQYSGMYTNNLHGNPQERPHDVQQQVSNFSMMGTDASEAHQASMSDVETSHAGGQVEMLSQSTQHQDMTNSGGMVETSRDHEDSDVTPSLDQ